MSDIQHEEAHTGPIKTPKQLLWTVIGAFVIPIFAIIGLVLYVTSANKVGPGAIDDKQSIAARLHKVGSVEIRDANRPLKSGEDVYKAQCAACHATGAAGAPKFADAAAWAPRIKSGLEAMVHSALAGKGAMAAQGGGDFDDTEIARGVVYMANNAGAKFATPERAAAAASADAAPAAAPAPRGSLGASRCRSRPGSCRGCCRCPQRSRRWQGPVRQSLLCLPCRRCSGRTQVWRQGRLGTLRGPRP